MPATSNLNSRLSIIKDLLREAEVNKTSEHLKEKLYDEIALLEKEVAEEKHRSDAQRHLLEGYFLKTREIIYSISRNKTGFHFCFISPQVNEILGLDEKELYADFKVWEQYIHPDDREKYKNALHGVFESRDNISLEYRVKHLESNDYLLFKDSLWSQNSEAETEFIYGGVRYNNLQENDKEEAGSQLKAIKTIDDFYHQANNKNTTQDIIDLLLSSINSIVKYNTARVYNFDKNTRTLSLRLENLSSRLRKRIMELTGNMTSYIPLITPGTRFHKILFDKKPYFTDNGIEIKELLKEHTTKNRIKAIAGLVKSIMNIKTTAILPLAHEENIYGLVVITTTFKISEKNKELISDMVRRGSTALSRIQVHKNLQSQMKIAENILNTLPVDIALMDRKQKYLFVNPSAIRDSKVRKWIIGKDDFDYARLRNISYDTAERRRAYFFKAVSNMQEVDWVDEYEVPEKEKKYILRRYYPCIENGKVEYVIGYGIDISNYKVIEKEKEKLLKDLASRLDELMQYNRIVSHNLRAPVASIMGLCDLLQHDLSVEDKNEIIESISVTIHSMDRVLRDLNQVLSIKLTLDKKIEDVDLEEIIQEVKNNLMVMISESSVQINLDLEKEACYFRSIKSYIHSIIYNLISNAIKYRKPDKPLNIEVKARAVDDNITICVSDNGLGINMNLYKDQVFGLYQKFHKHKGGQGLGLHLSQAQAESLGGKLTVDSELNKGSTFCLVVPSNKSKNIE